MWVHRLSNLDTENRLAICAACGPVAIRKKGTLPSGKVKWRCNKTGLTDKREYRSFVKDLCERCGFTPEHTAQLDVHHIDRNHSNNDPRNLQTLCANCHRLDRVGLL
jgi:hypothetical protein